jgi:hypothetical protein
MWDVTIIFKESLINTWKTSSRQKYKDKTMLNTRGTKLTLKLSTDMVSSPRKLLLISLSPISHSKLKGRILVA